MILDQSLLKEPAAHMIRSEEVASSDNSLHVRRATARSGLSAAVSDALVLPGSSGVEIWLR